MTTRERLKLTDTSTGAENCCGHATQADTAASPAEQLAECPVMTGTSVVKADAEAVGLYRDYEGQRYWLCCAGCGPAFDAEPGRYATA